VTFSLCSVSARLVAAATFAALAVPASLAAQDSVFFGLPQFFPGNLVVSRSVYDNLAGNVTVGETLPPNCIANGCAQATNNGTYPFVFNNVIPDASFGITSRIFLDQLTPFGFPINSIEVPNSLVRGVGSQSNQLVTSFSSKSELALHRSTDNQYLTFMGYVAPVNGVDVSNSNTPAAFDSTNPVPSSFFRAVARIDAFGNLSFTETNAYSGNNGRSAILNDTFGNDVYYTAGNAGNGSNPQPAGIVLGAGAQFISPANPPEVDQTPGAPTPLASFSVTELGDKADKVGKDDNFRGMTVFNNVLYYTKGSGSNGVNTVYFVDTTGTACPDGVGRPAPGAKLPTAPLNLNGESSSDIQSQGLPSNMCVLEGFPTTSNKSVNPVNFPFGLWFANANTLYVADEGDGFTGPGDIYTHAAGQTLAGLEKWTFNSAAGKWELAYTLTSGLNIGTPYTVPGYPTGANSATGEPWAPTTDGLRNLTGTVNLDGTVTVWAITSTTSGGGDTGADPNKLVVITDNLKSTALPVHEQFVTLRSAGFGEVLRGVSLTPGTFEFGTPSF
jgi:hypothetical protein